MKKIIRKLLPPRVLSAYHYAAALVAAAAHWFPSRKMAVIGVTGTKGKTTTAAFIWSVLQAGGYKAGLVSTAMMQIGDKQTLNPYHMTMPGPFTLQKILTQMVRQGVTHCVVETTSEGLKQWRHVGIAYDVAVFTNLSPEHIESHGSFDAYRLAKGRLFSALMNHAPKRVCGVKIPRTIIVNAESEHVEYFLSFPADKKVAFAVAPPAARGAALPTADYIAEGVQGNDRGAQFRVSGKEYALRVLGAFNVVNALPAIVVGDLFQIARAKIAAGLKAIKTIPGRMEEIDCGQDFRVVVDYAHEKLSMGLLLRSASALRRGASRVIVLLGAEGGGRDKAKRPLMGDIAGRLADYVVVSNVDPYNDDPGRIIEDIAVAAEAAGKIRWKNLFTIEDRREGIRQALSLARRGDIVLITGKGAEQSMIVNGKHILWDDRAVVREELKKILASSKRR